MEHPVSFPRRLPAGPAPVAAAGGAARGARRGRRGGPASARPMKRAVQRLSAHARRQKAHPGGPVDRVQGPGVPLARHNVQVNATQKCFCRQTRPSSPREVHPGAATRWCGGCVAMLWWLTWPSAGAEDAAVDVTQAAARRCSSARSSAARAGRAAAPAMIASSCGSPGINGDIGYCTAYDALGLPGLARSPGGFQRLVGVELARLNVGINRDGAELHREPMCTCSSETGLHVLPRPCRWSRLVRREDAHGPTWRDAANCFVGRDPAGGGWVRWTRWLLMQRNGRPACGWWDVVIRQEQSQRPLVQPSCARAAVQGLHYA